jgi:hypothetical protein
MKGCSKTRKNFFGGASTNMVLAYPSNNVPVIPNPNLAYTGKGKIGGASTNMVLAYPSTDVPVIPNPNLAYTGKGKIGGSCSSGITPPNLAFPENVNGENPAFPSTGPPSIGYNFLNPQGSLHGGSNKRKKNVQRKHRQGCRCSMCKNKMMGGSAIYPDGLDGNPWTPAISGWPGVDGIGGDRNHYSLNTYTNDVSRQILDIGANRPYLGWKGGSRKRKQKGGTVSNFLSQDLINLGRQFQFGVGSAYNALAGYPAPVNPLPWKGQLANTPSLSTIKATYL